MSSAVYVSRHPLVLDRLGQLRDITTEPKVFRQVLREMSQMLFFEATQELRVETQPIQTPLAQCGAHRIVDKIGLAPILRAGLGMAEAILEMLPTAPVWHIGLYRDHQTLRPVTYYNKLPARPNIDLAFVIDPMLATGGSAVAALDILKTWGLGRMKFIGLIAAPEGVEALQAAHPDVPIHLAAVDSHLDENKYIVPGLGDAGDRQFGTA
jgi:uracil phosphoribosyltransferase